MDVAGCGQQWADVKCEKAGDSGPLVFSGVSTTTINIIHTQHFNTNFDTLTFTNSHSQHPKIILICYCAINPQYEQELFGQEPDRGCENENEPFPYSNEYFIVIKT